MTPKNQGELWHDGPAAEPEKTGKRIALMVKIVPFMEEILHHLTCMKPCKQWYIYIPYQLVKDFFHQQYQCHLARTCYLSKIVYYIKFQVCTSTTVKLLVNQADTSTLMSQVTSITMLGCSVLPRVWRAWTCSGWLLHDLLPKSIYRYLDEFSLDLSSPKLVVPISPGAF